jgi:tRNA G18 (ribose-2'-O)-methylase SpoU
LFAIFAGEADVCAAISVISEGRRRAYYPQLVDEEPNPSVELSTNGVGPWRGELPSDPRYDRELLARGDSRNVIDRYRYWTIEAIIADLDETRHPFHVAIENWQHDMNIGSIVRSANAFGAESVHIIGRRRWNKRGAMVTDRYQHVLQHPDVAAFVTWAREHELPIVAIDNVPGSVRIETWPIPERCVLLFGQEGPGLSAEALAAADATVEITQFGSTRSINASAAAAVAMHAWVTQHVRFDR